MPDGADRRSEPLPVVQPPSPTGCFTFSNLFTDLPGTANTGTPFAASARTGSAVLDRLQDDCLANRAHFQEYFIQDDWRVSRRFTVNAGLRYTLNFPSTERPYQAAGSTWRPSSSNTSAGVAIAAGAVHRLNSAPWSAFVGLVIDKTVVGTGYAIVWIEMPGSPHPLPAGVPVPADGLAADAE